jgi:formylglycine-generating enzyme required for sulfatase activity
MRFVPIQAGTFTMGDANSFDDETPHQVTLTQPFELGVYEVTQEQYEAVMGTSPSEFDGLQNPVETVSWDDAVEFCRKLSAMPAEKKAGYVYRLPTEAEWEYACRAGTTTEYSFGDSESKLGEYAWYAKNSGHTTHPVGKKKPNAWGLYDMHGNVYEWCQDWYGDHPSGSVTDPTGAASGRGRVLRGGSFLSQTSDVRSAKRAYLQPVISAVTYGFRVLRSSVESTESTNTATVEPQDTSRKEDDAPEAVAAKAVDTEEARRWYDLFVVNQDNQRALKRGTIKGGETVTIELEAEKKRHIGFGTNVFQDRIPFADGESIIFHQTKGAVAGIGVTSKDGNGGGQEFTPVDGQLCFQLENNSNHTLKYVIYEVVENKEAVPHPTSTNATASQSQTQDSVPVVNSIGMRFVPISAGTFTRGQGESAHKVTLTQSFHLGQYEVTQEQYKQVMGSNPSGFKEATHPVETVNWNEAVEFCRKLSAMPQEKSAGFVYRLPTDAEWEYASRAGTTTGFSFGDDSAEMGNYGWLTSNSQETTHPVGQKKPNPWGLYDMYGNVWEWCLDWDGRRSSGSSVPVTDPTGPTSGSLRVFRRCPTFS